MVEHISSDRPDYRGELPSSQRLRPNQQPRNDSFRKAYKEGRPSKEEEELGAVEEKDDGKAPSLFDLSKKGPTKGKSSLARSSTLKDSFSDSLRPLSSKQDTLDQEPGLLTQEEGAGTEGELYAANEEMPVPDGTSQEPESSLPQQASSMPDETKKAQNQAQLAEAINRQQGALQSQKSKKSEGPSFESKESGSVSKKDKSKGEARSSGATDQAKVDAGAVNSSLQSVAFQTEKAEESQEVVRSATIKDLATQIIDRIQVMRKEDQTSTMITLRHPPILEGATITLTTSDHAKKEFNISFANLSPDAKLFLDRKLNEDSLTQTLERKGIVVHMVTTTTQAENLINVDAGQTFRDRQEQQQQQQQQQQRRQQSQDEEEMS